MRMNGNYLLDSNVIINVFRGDQNAISRTKKITIVHLPVIVIGELFYGAHKSNRTPERISQIEQLEETVIILDITKTTARIYGEIKDQLRTKGRPIPENDIWIAALAKEHDLTLLTEDRHFEQVEDI